MGEAHIGDELVGRGVDPPTLQKTEDHEDDDGYEEDEEGYGHHHLH